MRFLEKLDKIERSKLSELDSKLNECAYLIAEPFRYATNQNRWTTKNWVYDFSDFAQCCTPALERMYAERCPTKKREEVQNTIRCFLYEFEDLLTALDQDRLTKENGYEYKELELCLPIMIYCVAVNNLFNHFANTKRNYREQNRIQEDIADSDEKSRKRGVAQIIKRRQMCQITRKEAGIRTERTESIAKKKKQFSGSISKMRKYLNEENETNATKLKDKDFRRIIPLDYALQMLENHRSVRRYVESAQIGLFLRKILEIGYHNDKPLDKLLRLYMANQIDQILIRTGIMNALRSDVFFDVESKNNLLKWYFDSLHPTDSANYLGDMYGCLNWILDDFKGIIEQKKGKTETFQSDLYNAAESSNSDKKPDFCSCYKELEEELSRLELKPSDVDDLLEFYLNQKEMETVSHWENIVEEYHYDLIKILTGKEDARTISAYDHVILSKMLRAIRCEKITDSIDDALWSLFDRKKKPSMGSKTTS